ncbi:uncharacterized protein BJ212DRAFT_1296138 [Suillus subaureus]|uniref:Uncharacterized protein n=1 Tax=Suillus subaureus TaxID=48587 RepID=A0A9P7JI56_9AGAM|nr:uncharacterized protein BJ212DRAFT_1296138 [Suillus subaureus]KAG1823531.1 hypothetical protein BJ212DRAFT_1296138 [Suillus subaureus]
MGSVYLSLSWKFPRECLLAVSTASYVMRVVQWARTSRIRINLDLHITPGSQNESWDSSMLSPSCRLSYLLERAMIRNITGNGEGHPDPYFAFDSRTGSRLQACKTWDVMDTRPETHPRLIASSSLVQSPVWSQLVLQYRWIPTDSHTAGVTFGVADPQSDGVDEVYQIGGLGAGTTIVSSVSIL